MKYVSPDSICQANARQAQARPAREAREARETAQGSQARLAGTSDWIFVCLMPGLRMERKGSRGVGGLYRGLVQKFGNVNSVPFPLPVFPFAECQVPALLLPL